MQDGIYLKEMGKKVREIRLSKGLSLDALKAITGFQRSTLSDLENGKSNSRILTLKFIAEVLDVDVKDFL